MRRDRAKWRIACADAPSRRPFYAPVGLTLPSPTPLSKLPQNGVESFYPFLISDFALFASLSPFFPLLRAASSTAVLVQLTPLLGALVGVIATLFLVAICVVIFIKFRSKRSRRHVNGDATTTEADKGSAEPLSRNMGSHSSLEDKNPDVVPQEANSEDEFHLEEKAFDRLNMESQRILYTPPTRINSASPPPPSLSPTFNKQVSVR